MKKECKYSCFDHFLKTWTYFFASNEVQRSNPDYKHTMSRLISRNVLLLSLISLCTDLASELLYPVMPGYLRSIGFSMALIGLLEGIAEAIAGLSKGYFGHLSDVKGRRLRFVQRRLQLGRGVGEVSIQVGVVQELARGISFKEKM